MKNFLALSYVVAFLGIALLAVLFNFDKNLFIALGQEDRFAENLTAVFYVVAAFFSFWAVADSYGTRNRFFGRASNTDIWLVLLSMFFVLCFLEEISWGQRIFGWKTPDAISTVNGHHETNFHNMLDSRPFGLHPDDVFALIWLAYCVVIPVLNFASSHVRRFLAWIGLPVPPLALAGIFVGVFLIQWTWINWGWGRSRPMAKAFREYRELGYAYAYACVACYFWLRSRSIKAGPAFDASPVSGAAVGVSGS